MEDSTAKCDLNCEGLVQEVSEEDKFNMFPRDHLFVIFW